MLQGRVRDAIHALNPRRDPCLLRESKRYGIGNPRSAIAIPAATPAMLASATGALNTRAGSRTPISPVSIDSLYGRRDLGSRLVLLADPEKSIRYMSTDTVDRGLLDLNPWFPLNVRWFHEWIAEHPSFRVWASIGDWSWIPNGVADLGALASLKAVLKDCVPAVARRTARERPFRTSDALFPNDDRRPPDVPLLPFHAKTGGCPSRS
jgi:hypothetical protein